MKLMNEHCEIRKVNLQKHEKIGFLILGCQYPIILLFLKIYKFK